MQRQGQGKRQSKTDEGKGKAYVFDGECSNCKKYGHKKKYCWALGGGAHQQRRVSFVANVIEEQTARSSAETNVIKNWVMPIDNAYDIDPNSADKSGRI